MAQTSTQYGAISAWLECLRPQTRRTNSYVLNSWCKYLDTTFGKKAKLKTNTETCYRYIAYLRSKNLAELSIKRHYAILRRAYSILVLCDVFSKNPWNGVSVKFTNERRRPYELIPDAQVTAMFKHAKGRYGARQRALLALMFGGGLRLGECVALNIKDLVNQNGIWCVWLGHTKTGESQWQSLPQWAADIVLEVVEPNRSRGPEFPILSAAYWGAIGRLSTHNARHIFQRAGIKACGKKYSPHSARATAITWLLDKKVPIEVVQIFSRHKQINSVIDYDKRRKGIAENPGLLLAYSGQSGTLGTVGQPGQAVAQ